MQKCCPPAPPSPEKVPTDLCPSGKCTFSTYNPVTSQTADFPLVPGWASLHMSPSEGIPQIPTDPPLSSVRIPRVGGGAVWDTNPSLLRQRLQTQKISLYCELSHQGYGFWQDCVSIFPTCLDVTLLSLIVEGNVPLLFHSFSARTVPCVTIGWVCPGAVISGASYAAILDGLHSFFLLWNSFIEICSTYHAIQPFQHTIH